MHAHCNRLLMLAGVVLTGMPGCAAPDPGSSLGIRVASSAPAEACAIKLPPAADIVYRDAAPDVHAETNMESLLRIKVMMLIVRDHIKRAEARPAAERAAECLELLQQ